EPREVLARRIFEPGHLVQVVMIEDLEQRAPGGVHHLVVDEPTRFFVDRPRDGDLDFEAMSVQPRTLVSRRDFGKPMCGFEPELLDEANVHGTTLAGAAGDATSHGGRST